MILEEQIKNSSKTPPTKNQQFFDKSGNKTKEVQETKGTSLLKKLLPK